MYTESVIPTSTRRKDLATVQIGSGDRDGGPQSETESDMTFTEDADSVPLEDDSIARTGRSAAVT